MRAIRFAFAACALAAMTALLAPTAGAETYSNGYQLARFKVELKGSQTIKQQRNHLAADPCDSSDFSSGSETVKFRSKPFVITASYFPGQKNPEFFSGKRLSIPTTANVERSYTPRIGYPPASAECGDNGGGVENVLPPDCGTRTVKFGVKLLYGLGPDAKDEDTLVLNTDTVDDPFERCTGNPNGFPRLILFDQKENYIGANLSQKELFDPKFQKWISIADGKFKDTDAYGWSETKLHWDVSFTRLKNEIPGAK